jgi:hypothetical protein
MKLSKGLADPETLTAVKAMSRQFDHIDPGLDVIDALREETRTLWPHKAFRHVA